MTIDVLRKIISVFKVYYNVIKKTEFILEF